ncbi:MAG TPA: hypothetical protein VI893_04300 [Thermoplasmata archaeon]|nr:hypothetical protein [Thermoplasmata archaeon]
MGRSTGYDAAAVIAATEFAWTDADTISRLIDSLFVRSPRGGMTAADAKAGILPLIAKNPGGNDPENHTIPFGYVDEKFGWVEALHIRSVKHTLGKKVMFDPKLEFLYFQAGSSEFDAKSLRCSDPLVELLTLALPILKTTYAWGGHLNRDILRPGRSDPRKQVWGFNYFGPEHHKKLDSRGLDELARNGWRLHKDNIGGLFLLWLPTPFICAEEVRKKAARLLHTGDLF